MIHSLHPVDNLAQVSYTKPAEVTSVSSTGYHVRLEHLGASFNVNAELAIPRVVQLEVGDRVLVSGTGFEQCFITGLLGEARSRLCPELQTANGAVAVVRKTDQGEEVLAVKNAKGHLLFEYDSQKDQTKVFTPTGDLSFLAPNGDIKFVTGESVICESNRSFEVHTAGFADVQAGLDNPTRLSMGQEGLIANTRKLKIGAEQAQLNLHDLNYHGERFSGVLANGKLVVGKMETLAKRIVEKAKNVYRQVEELSQLKAKRTRTLVEKQHLVQSGSTQILAKDNVRIDGEGIHLG